MEQNPLLQYEEGLRASYLVVLASIATADHDNSQGEIAFMQQMGAASQLTDASIQEVAKAMQQPEAVNLAGHLSKLKGSDLKFSLLADVMNMIYADGDMDQNEVAQIAKINGALDITQQQFDTVTQYVKKANQAAASQEVTPGLGLLGGGSSSLGDLMGLATSFLGQSGMQQQFQQAGIPTKNFEGGSTIGTILTGLAGSFIQSQMAGGQQQQQQGGGMGGMLGGLVGSMLGGSQQPSQTTNRGLGQSTGNSGLGSLIGNVISSPQGQQMMQDMLGKLMAGNQKGAGLPNLGALLGGGGQQGGQQQGGQQIGNTVGALINMFMK